METLPSEIVDIEIIPKVTNSLDRAQLRAVYKHFAKLITPVPQPAWLLDERLPKKIREKEKLWEALGVHTQYFPTPHTPFHLSLGKKIQVKIKWYSDKSSGRLYEFGVDQKRPSSVHVCTMMTPPKAIGCQHSNISYLARSWNPPPLLNLEEYTWIRSPHAPFCFYIPFN